MTLSFFRKLSAECLVPQSSLLAPGIFHIQSLWGEFIFAPTRGFAGIYNKPNKQKILSLLSKVNEIADLKGLSKPCSVTFDLSHLCQLNCNYCSINNSTDKSQLTIKTAKICIDHIVSNALEIGHNKVGTLLMGKGEPTTNWETLSFILNYIKNRAIKNNLKYFRCVTTNGILSKNKTKELIKNTDIIILSWDGLEEIQNKNRPLKSGKGSFQYLLQTANLLHKNKTRFHIRPTITQECIEKTREITELFIKFSPERLLYQPLYQVGRGTDLESVAPHDFCDSYFTALPIAINKGIRLEYPGNHSIRRQFCSAYNGIGFSISATNKVSICDCVYEKNEKWGEELIYGCIKKNKIVIDPIKHSKLQNIIPEKIEKCSECFVYHFCKGGCLNNHLANCNKYTPLGERNMDSCKINKIIMLFKILYQINGKLPCYKEKYNLNIWI